ncbi:MAG: LTA synthase family protein [Lachnospiraceae bacterium]|nr:LTA synthase family protein [Lachnospiraceae bacterium]
MRYKNILRSEFFKGTLTGYSVIVFLNSFFCLVFGNPGITLSVLTVLYFVFGIVNYFIYTFHGTPFTMGEIKNFRTAMAVAKSYTFVMPVGTMIFLAGLLLTAFLIQFFCSYEGFLRWLPLGLLAVFGIFLFFSFFSPKPLIERKLNTSSWIPVLEKYGYIPAFVRQTLSEIRGPVVKPDPYSREDNISFIGEVQGKNPDSGRKPDIIFILNETFYDLKDAVDLNPDMDTLTGFRSIDNALRGRVVTPRIGGGTNVSEYECLSSNSMQIMPYVATPFNVLDLRKANTILTYLKSMGYRTFATHPGETFSYRRNVAYPAMGFDRITFAKDYREPEYYGNRTSYITDSSMYRNMIRWYEEFSDDSPLFFYGLTIQNHGDWISNTEEQMLVKSGKDFGKYTHIINEFQSCIRLSDDALTEFIDHFRTVDRDVVIVMTGDHAPSFVKDRDFHELGGKDDFLALGSTPYIIWSNRELKALENMDVISMPLLLPAVFDAAGMKQSPYCSFLNLLRHEVPILRGTDDKNLSERERDLLNRYYSLEYLNYSEPEKFVDYWKCI